MSNCKTIAMCNQKGGVGKTTSTVNLGVGLAMQGKRVLLVDADPQGDLTTCLGWKDTDSLPITLLDKMSAVMRNEAYNPFSGILHHDEKVDLIPANLAMSALEMSLVEVKHRETVMKNYLSRVKDQYDYILIDCMPSLGMITFNALTAADSVIIPVQAQYLPAKAMTYLLGTISNVKKHTNPNLKIEGILLTLVDGRTNLAKSTADALRENFGYHIKIYRSTIPVAVKAAEAAIMLVVLDSILNRITQNRAKGRNTFIFIDEIYLLFQHEYSANFLFTLWKRVRKYGAYATGITQNVDDLLQSHTARTMLANSEFIIMLNQASTDRLELAKLLNISDLQMSYITNVEAGHGLIKVGSSLVPFANKFPKNTKLYKLMTTKPGESA